MFAKGKPVKKALAPSKPKSVSTKHMADAMRKQKGKGSHAGMDETYQDHEMEKYR